MQESLWPKIINDNIISFTAWKFNVKGTVYSQAKTNEIVDGWNSLTNENIPLLIYTYLFLWLNHKPEETIEVDKSTVISNILEPDILEILRLCYWIVRCKQIFVDKNSFLTKCNEVKANLMFLNQEEFKDKLHSKLVIFGKIMQDGTLPHWETELNTLELINELQSFRSNVSSFVSEFLLASLVHEAGFHVQFIGSSERTKTSDLIIDSFKTEVKTFLDSYKDGVKIESTLFEEIVLTLNDSLSKGSDITFMFLTFSQA